MIKIRAQIKLVSSEWKLRLLKGYRPMFNFYGNDLKGYPLVFDQEGNIVNKNKYSFADGKIIFTNDNIVSEEVVEITALFRQVLGDDFGIGKEFVFGELNKVIGKGVVLEILEDE